MAISSKKYKSKNYEKVVALHRKAAEAWRSRNIEINRERNRLWKQNNKAMVAFMNAGSRERKKTKLSNFFIKYLNLFPTVIKIRLKKLY